MARLSRFEVACLGVVGVAFLLRVALVLHPDLYWDSAWYLALGRMFSQTGTFLTPWTQPPQVNGYWPPLFPVFLSAWVRVLGASYGVEVTAACSATALLTLATFLCTRDLFRRDAEGRALASAEPGARTRAFAAMALVAANPAFFVTDGHGMSESLLALAVMLAVWAFLRGLKDPRFLVLALAFGVLAYFGKANLGVPFVVATVAAVGAWRLWRRGWRAMARSPWDLGIGAAALVGALLLAFARGGRLGSVGLTVIGPVAQEWLHPATTDVLGLHVPNWAAIFPFKLAFALAFLGAVTLPFSLQAGGAIRSWREERTGALWLATLIPLVAGAVFTTAFYATEHRPLVDFDNIRYLTPSIVPALWLLLPSWRPEEDPQGVSGTGHRTRHETWLGLAAGGYVALLLLSPIAGQATLSRLELLLLLALPLLGMGVIAARTRYAATTRREAGGEVARIVPATPAPMPARAWWAFFGVLAATPVLAVAAGAGVFPDVGSGGALAGLVLTAGLLLALAILARPQAWSGVLAVGLVVGALGFFVTAWYACVAIGLAIAACAVSRKAMALAMVLVLLAATAPALTATLPVEAVAHDVHRYLPQGATVGASPSGVYYAAAAPSDLIFRDVAGTPPPGIDAMLVTGPQVEGGVANFTRVALWNYTFSLSPTLAARVWIESSFFNERVDDQPTPGIALYLRTNSTLYQRLPSS